MENKTNEKLLKLIEQLFSKKYDGSAKVKDLLSKIESADLTFEDAHEYAIEIGELLSDSFIEIIDPNKLPNQTMFYDIGKDLLFPTMGHNHELICDYAGEVQNKLNLKANVHLKVQRPKLNEDRIKGIVFRLDQEKYKDIQWVLKDPIINSCQSIVDDVVKENIKFHYESGLHPEVTRSVEAKPCKWCAKLEGTFKYPKDVPDEFYKRHRDCRCIVTYDPKDGRGVQDAHSKQWEKDEDRVKGRIKFERENLLNDKISDDKKDKLKSFSKKSESDFEKLKRITYEEAYKRGYDPVPIDKVVPLLQKKSDEWFNSLEDIEKQFIERYTFNSPNKDELKLYEKLNGFLIDKYVPVDQKEKDLLVGMISNLHTALLKYDLDEDIIVYRKEDYIIETDTMLAKFLSTSLTKKGTLGKSPNMSIIVPKGTIGAYLGNNSLFPRQKEFLLDGINKLEKITDVDGKIIYEVKK